MDNSAKTQILAVLFLLLQHIIIASKLISGGVYEL